MGNANEGSRANEHTDRAQARHANRLRPRRADHAADEGSRRARASRPRVHPRARGRRPHRHSRQHRAYQKGHARLWCRRGPVHQGQRQPGHLGRQGRCRRGMEEGQDRRGLWRRRHHGPFQLGQNAPVPPAAHRRDAAHGGHRPHVRRHRLHGKAAGQAYQGRPVRGRARARRGRRGLYDHPLRHQQVGHQDL